MASNTETQITRKGITASNPIKQATFAIPESLHRRVRIFAAENDTTLQDFAIAAFEDRLARLSPKGH